MADSDLATKAPEVDAVEASPFPDDTPAQSGVSLGVSPVPNPVYFMRLLIEKSNFYRSIVLQIARLLAEPLHLEWVEAPNTCKA